MHGQFKGCESSGSSWEGAEQSGEEAAGETPPFRIPAIEVMT